MRWVDQQNAPHASTIPYLCTITRRLADPTKRIRCMLAKLMVARGTSKGAGFRRRVVQLMALAALGWIVVVFVSPAQGYVPSPPYLACFNSSEGALVSLGRSLSPANDTYVQAGTPVTFSGNSGAPVTFAIASSSALLSSPDIDSGLGALQPGTSSYTFTSTKAAVTPGILIRWDASFSNATLTACEGMTPKTYTTAVRTFTVVSPPSTEAEAAAKKHQEEAAAEAKKKREEEAPVGTGSVSKPKVKSLTRAQRLAAALKACHKKGRKQRAVCERQARRAYGPLHRKKK